MVSSSYKIFAVSISGTGNQAEAFLHSCVIFTPIFRIDDTPHGSFRFLGTLKREVYTHASYLGGPFLSY